MIATTGSRQPPPDAQDATGRPKRRRRRWLLVGVACLPVALLLLSLIFSRVDYRAKVKVSFKYEGKE